MEKINIAFCTTVDADRVFVLLHAFEKRSQKLPQREIRIAMERMNADRKSKEG